MDSPRWLARFVDLLVEHRALARPRTSEAHRMSRASQEGVISAAGPGFLIAISALSGRCLRRVVDGRVVPPVFRAGRQILRGTTLSLRSYDERGGDRGKSAAKYQDPARLSLLLG